jgi:hypothetical protein
MWSYIVSHSQLLLRSPKAPGLPTRIEVSETDNEFYKNVVCGRPDAGDRMTYAHRVRPRADKIVISSCERRRND